MLIVKECSKKPIPAPDGKVPLDGRMAKFAGQPKQRKVLHKEFKTVVPKKKKKESKRQESKKKQRVRVKTRE